MGLIQRVKNIIPGASFVVNKVKESYNLGKQQRANPQSRQTVFTNRSPFEFITPIGVAGAGAKTAGTVIKTGKNFIARQLSNPFAGVTIKEGFKNIGKRLAGFSTTGGLVGLSRGVIKKMYGDEPFSWKDVGKSTVTGATFGLSSLGALEGFGEVGAKKAKNFITGIFDKTPALSLPNVPTPTVTTYVDGVSIPRYDIPNVGMPSFNLNIPSMQLPQLPASVASPSYTAPSISVGTPSGFGDVLPLLLLGLGGGLAGYALGKRKKKKRKYKKKKKQ